MNQIRIFIAIAALLTFSGPGSLFAESMHDMGHGTSMPGMSHGGSSPERSGTNIQNSTVEGYALSYYLLDMRANIAALKAAGKNYPGMDKAYHLMVYVTPPAGKKLEIGAIEFTITDSKGTKQTFSAMKMGDAFGADVAMPAAGKYGITARIVLSGKPLTDTFSYTNP